MTMNNDEITSKRIAPKYDNLLGHSVAEMCDEYVTKIRDLIIANYPDIDGFEIRVTRLENAEGFRHKFGFLRKKKEMMEDDNE